ncbi:MAG: SPW repeat protein [Pseudomonadota bacterium]
MEKNANWENWLNLVMGAWVFIIPWSITHNMTSLSGSGAMWNFWVVGAVVFVSAAFALQDIKPWEEWTNLVAGVWLILSPVLFGYASQSSLLWNSVGFGLAIAVLSGLALPIAQKANLHSPG